MTIQTTNIDATSGNAVNLTKGDEVFFTIANGVVVEAQNGLGIVADSTDNFFIYNNGSIVANDPGVELEESSDHFYNERGGSVFGFDGVDMGTTGEALVNYGDVSAFASGVYDTAGGNTISNFGTIEGPVGLSVAAGGEVITNSNTGAIDGGIAISSGADTITNAGSIDGAVAFAGTGITNSLTNSGEIIGNIKFSSAHSTLTNAGSVTGDVTMVGTDTLINTGVIHGDVALGVSDIIELSVGEVTGAITGKTNDLFAFSGNFGHETIDKFIGGTGSTHDTIRFATNDFGSFAAVQSHMSQVGSDVVIRLDGTDTITLAGVKLSTLVAADFKFV
jgi:hypothetical protein